jgi:dihydroorotase
LEEKRAESVWDVKPGFPNLETIVPLILTQINKGRLSIADLIRLMAEKPVKIFHLKGRGRLAKGYDADIAIVDTHREYRIDASKFHSKAKYSPFDGWVVKGRAVRSYVAGSLVMENNVILAKGGSGGIVSGKMPSTPSP